jgi:hypothetical protein
MEAGMKCIKFLVFIFNLLFAVSTIGEPQITDVLMCG